MKTVVIIGAGASGLVCASTLSRSTRDIKIIVLEQFSKTARKLLATGNGRCNLSNKNMRMEFYNTKDARIQSIVEGFSAPEYFSELGLMTRYDGDLLYPYSNQAATVKKALLDSLHHVQIIEECRAISIVNENNGYIVKTNTMDIYADYIVYATGSKANRLSGEDNLQMLQALHLDIKEVTPSLVQLHTSPSYPKLKGVRVKAKVSLLHNNKAIDTRQGELLFTDTGVSGICVMQLSRWVSSYNKNLSIQMDMLPEYEDAQWKELVIKRKERFGKRYLDGIFNEKLVNVLLREQINPKRMILNITGTNDFTKAQVMHGGLALSEVNESLECIRYPGVFVIGEALDVDGDCGGYNLHFAFASGNHVGKILSGRVNKNVTD